MLELCNCGRCPLHFSQLNISATLPRLCRSAIPPTWGTCHANVFVCVVLVLLGVSSHCGTPGDESFQYAQSPEYTVMTNHQVLDAAFNFSVHSFMTIHPRTSSYQLIVLAIMVVKHLHISGRRPTTPDVVAHNPAAACLTSRVYTRRRMIPENRARAERARRF